MREVKLTKPEPVNELLNILEDCDCRWKGVECSDCPDCVELKNQIEGGDQELIAQAVAVIFGAALVQVLLTNNPEPFAEL